MDDTTTLRYNSLVFLTIAATMQTATPALHSPGQPIPIAAMVGGAIGGALLAALVTAAWIWWGKSIKRKQLRARLETVSTHLR